jgi:hypothetical protein
MPIPDVVLMLPVIPVVVVVVVVYKGVHIPVILPVPPGLPAESGFKK